MPLALGMARGRKVSRSFGCGAKIVPINTMNAVAANASEYMHATGTQIRRIGTILDAKRKQFYISVFDNIDNEWVRVSRDFVMRAPDFIENFANDKEPVWLLGEGLVYYKDDFASDGVRIISEDFWFAKAKNLYRIGRKMAKVGRFVDAVNLLPFYLRRPEALENWEKRKGVGTTEGQS